MLSRLALICRLTAATNLLHAAAMSSSAATELSSGCKGAPLTGAKLPLPGTESIMTQKAHGTTATPVRAPLRWSLPADLANRICCHNRHYAEPRGSFLSTPFLAAQRGEASTTFYDSVTGRPLFVAPVGRSWAEWEAESRAHGWPSFRDAEVIWEDVRVLPDGEAVSTAGTHLGHNLPDGKGNRYCINLVSVAAQPPTEAA